MKTVVEMENIVINSLDSISKNMENCVDNFKKECADETNNSFDIVQKAKKMIESFEQLQNAYETRLSQLEMLEMMEDK